MITSVDFGGPAAPEPRGPRPSPRPSPEPQVFAASGAPRIELGALHPFPDGLDMGPPRRVFDRLFLQRPAPWTLPRIDRCLVAEILHYYARRPGDMFAGAVPLEALASFLNPRLGQWLDTIEPGWLTDGD